MNKLANSITARMSLREPQSESLDILAKVMELAQITKNTDPATALDSIKSCYPSVIDFERNFPSLCFSLATGVGKTRLMGAFISYLFLTRASRHFFVLAPNLTIYEKLISDFSPESPKYVFKGIPEFATNRPVIVTGDNFAQGQGVRFDLTTSTRVVKPRKFDSGHTVVFQQRLFQTDETVVINIFNVSKIDAQVRKGNAPKIKQLQEYIGESYFDYLSSLPDLVLLMDEAHRYRAAAGTKAINELKPILGLELTATPKAVGQNAQAFKNVVYSYPLGAAMKDGFVKEPAVATRKDFRPEDYTTEALEKIKLEDGIHHHEHVKVELEVYSFQHGKPLVHPFMLVVAQDTSHAAAIRELIESESFFEGRYKDRVIEVHSNQTGQESDEATQRLLAVEHDPKTEIVIHVNKLKEGWDVTNLYTIVPLRASASEILTEQTIGRGLRLPYGLRTGVESIDRLTIVAHDKFQAILDAANNPDSIIRKTITIGEGGDIPVEQTKAVVVPPMIESVLGGDGFGVQDAAASAASAVLDTPQKREVANVVLDVVKQFERLESSQRLKEPEIRQQIELKVREVLMPAQMQIEGINDGRDISAIINVVTSTVADLTIDVPKISVLATSDVTYHFSDFELLNLKSIRYQPVSQDILIQELRTNERSLLLSSNTFAKEERLEDYVVRSLMDRMEIDYDRHAELLYKLAGQLVSHLRTYLPTDEQIENVLLYHQTSINNFVFAQLMDHCIETPTDYEVKISKGFSVLRENKYNISGQVQDFRAPVTDKSSIKRMMFGGFRKCCYHAQKFDSDTERRLAMVLEDDPAVIRWMKPAVGHFQIDWKCGIPYQPDFVVETHTEKVICETKSAAEMQNEDVQLKAKAALKWCAHANEHAQQHGGKRWSYLLIPHSDVVSNRTLDGLKASFQTV